MPVLNIHSRVLPVSCDAAGDLLDGLAGPHDKLWAAPQWPAMRLDRPVAVGAAGGHGPIRYTVTGYQPRRWVRFGFTAPAGFDGFHEFTVEPVEQQPACARLTHRVVLRPRGPARLTWPLAFRWLHDALLEDVLDNAERAVSAAPARPARWGPYVRALRHWMRRTIVVAGPTQLRTGVGG
ncbi:MAG: SRPBCC family protein [Nocardia sp.]|nr:SRPBCC family protein [Nocardia sp.]